MAAAGRAVGNQPGLYGGTQDQKVCDPDALVSFLEQNPDKAAAWASALDITPSGIRQYVAGLTPVLLRTDTRVTNHGFVDGAATPHESVLQAGTAVLVDVYGVPRVRCSCGNPLTEPAPISSLPTAIEAGEITLVGAPWADWQPSSVVVITGDVAVGQFVLWDVINGGTFVVLIGGSAPTTTTTEPPTTTTTTPPSTTTTTPTPVDPLLDDDCRNDPPPSDPEEYGSGDVGCDPSTGDYVCYVGAETVPCPGRP